MMILDQLDIDCGMYGVAKSCLSMQEEIPLIEKLEWLMLQQEQVAIPEKHIFSNGIYCKEIFIPKGTLAIGHAHTEEFMEAVTAGKMIMFGEEGGRIEVSAPYIGIGKPFKRKMGYALEDTVWATFHVTQLTDVQAIEDNLIIKSPTWLKMEKILFARGDYKKILAELGVSEKIVREQSENENDQISMPSGHRRVKIGKSEIEGFGLFAGENISAETIICPSRIGSLRTPAGRFTNHSNCPNAVMKNDETGDIFLISIKDIKRLEEITVDYRQALQVNLLVKETL